MAREQIKMGDLVEKERGGEGEVNGREFHAGFAINQQILEFNFALIETHPEEQNEREEGSLPIFECHESKSVPVYTVWRLVRRDVM